MLLLKQSEVIHKNDEFNALNTQVNEKIGRTLSSNELMQVKFLQIQEEISQFE